jgi:competence protein ComEC
MRKESHKLGAALLAGAAFFATLFLMREVLQSRPAPAPLYYQLDIGQGDAEVIELPGGAIIMTDAGPDAAVVDALEKALPGADRIDLAIISHPQLDHFNGFNALIDRYPIGAFVINGRDDDPGVKAWPELLGKIREKHIPLITLGAGDVIYYGSSSIRMLSPDAEFVQSGELNDTGFVEYVSTTAWTALLTADTGTNIEDAFFATSAPRVDILKIGHHGSKYSTGDRFLDKIRPKVALISAGAKNTYGHPAPSTISRLARFHIPVFRTDEKGTITIRRKGNTLRITSEK